MTKKITTAVCLVALGLFSGCLEDDDKDASLTMERDLPMSFTITLNTSGDGTSYESYDLDLCDQSEGSCETILSYGANYSGTVVTTCENSGYYTSTGMHFECETVYNTSAPMGDPESQTTTIILESGEYELDHNTGYEYDTVERFRID